MKLKIKNIIVYCIWTKGCSNTKSENVTMVISSLSNKTSLKLLFFTLLFSLIAVHIRRQNVITSTSASRRFGGHSTYRFTQVTNKTNIPRLYSLVDVPINFNFSRKRNKNAMLHTILWYNKPFWITTHDFMSSCEYDNCLVTVNKSKIDNASAVIFCPSHPGMGFMPPVKPQQRDPRQAWVFYSLEPPMNFYYADYRSNSWINTMNWSMTYRLDSDVQAPYGMIRSKAVLPVRNYSEIFIRKTKMAVMVSSHCRTVGKRETYVKQLKRLGLEIDVLGACGIRTEAGDSEQFIRKINTYKFFLSFENSFCHDYMTEKVFHKYNYDLLLVVRGGADYAKSLPGIPYIDTSKFSNNSELVAYLQELGGNESKYVEMLKRKDKYEGLGEGPFGYPYAMCDLCRKLNNLGKNQNQIRSIYDYLNYNQCYEPKDLT